MIDGNPSQAGVEPDRMIAYGQPSLGPKEQAAVAAVLASGQITRGPRCAEFEARLAGEYGRPCHVVSSGTGALHLALLACGVGQDDAVIVPLTTFVATANAVLYCGALPVFVDVDPKTWTIDRFLAERCITPRTKAILPVHLYGVPSPSFADVVGDHFRQTGRSIHVIEDAAESIGSLRRGHTPHGDLTVTSFYGNKTITAGEGGAVFWADDVFGKRIRHLAGQAMTETRYVHDCLGWNYRMTEMQAAIGVAQLSRLDEFLAKRRDVFRWYDERLPEHFVRQAVEPGDRHGCWAFAVAKQWGQGGPMDAPAVARRMAAGGVETRPIFPPVSRFPHFKDCPVRGGLVGQNLHDHGLVLPTHCSLTESDIDRVCEVLIDAAG